MRVGKAARWMLCILAVMLSLSFAAAESANEAGRWELEANQMDQYLDHAFEEYLAGNTQDAVGDVSNAYFKVYDIAFEMNVMNRISGPRKNKTEMEFSNCKGLLKRDSTDENNRLEARTALNRLKGILREDCNKLSAMDGYRQSQITYWKGGEQVASDPFPEYGGNGGSETKYASWTEAAGAMDEILETAKEAYDTFQADSALDNINTAYYSVFEESGLSHKIYTELGVEAREEAEAQFAALKEKATAESHKSRTFNNAVKSLKSVVKEKAAAIDEKEAAAKAEEAAAVQAEAEAEAAKSDPGWVTFLGSFGIIVREGLEAILVIAAIIAYLTKSGNAKSLRNIYIGAIAGILASFAAAVILYFVKQAVAGAGQGQEIIDVYVSEIMGITGLTRPGTLKLISSMEQEGLLEEVSGRKRGRVYLADIIRSAEYE